MSKAQELLSKITDINEEMAPQYLDVSNAVLHMKTNKVTPEELAMLHDLGQYDKGTPQYRLLQRACDAQNVDLDGLLKDMADVGQ